MESLRDIGLWYLVWTAISLAFTPVVLLVFRQLPDRGAAFARVLSVLLVVWPVWFLSGISGGFVPFTAAALWITVVIGAAVSWYFGHRANIFNRETIHHLAISEIGALSSFAAYAWFRGYDPTIQWQEKLSDLMLLSSVMKSVSVPPHDAWLAQESVNYYYFGYVPWAGIGKMTGLLPSVVYNLALVSVFVCTVMCAIGVAANVLGRYYNLSLARIGGAVAAIFVVLMATPWSTVTAFNRGRAIWNDYWFSYFWDASRQLDGGRQAAITEFPAFSFQLGDLHPHVLALPFTILAMGCAWMIALLPTSTHGGTFRAQWGRIAITGAIAGGLYAMNTWDMPAYLLICFVALLAGTRAWSGRDRIGSIAILLASAFVVWLPFHLSFQAPTASAGTPFADAIDRIPLIGSILASVMSWYGEATTPWQYVGLFGYAWLIAMALIVSELIRRREGASDPAVNKMLIGIAVAAVLVGVLLPMPLLILAALPIILIVGLFLRDASPSPANAALLLIATGSALTLIPEFFYLRDVFDNRMNIVFKLYYQAWTMFAIAAGIGFIVVWESVRRFRVATILFPAAAAIMIVGGVGASSIGAHQWVIWRTEAKTHGWIGMDGLYFLKDNPNWAGESEAIAWLAENASPNDRMLAAGGCEFTLDIGTTASGSGVPIIIGWQGHEAQWHLGQPGFHQEIMTRVAAIESLWETLDPELLDRYGITLIYIGPMEMRGPIYPHREVFSDTCAPGPFANASNPNWPGRGWELIYINDDGVRIYRRDSH